MKAWRLIGFVVAAAVLAVAGSAEAGVSWTFQTYHVDGTTGATAYGEADAGVTVSTSSSADAFTASGPSAVSPMVRRHGPANTKDLEGDAFSVSLRGTSRTFAAEILAMDPTLLNSLYAYATGTTDYSSGTTGTWFIKTAVCNTAEEWARAERLPVLQGVAANSSASPYPSVFQVDPWANYLRADFCPTGVTPLNAVPLRVRELPLGTETAGVPAAPDKRWTVDATSGASWYATIEGEPPDYARRVRVSVQDACRWTADGRTAPTTTSGNHLDETRDLWLSREQLRRFGIISAAGNVGVAFSFHAW